MKMNTFWETIQKSKDGAPEDRNKQLELLKNELHHFDKGELVAFEKIFHELAKKSYTWDLWGVACIIDGCGDDGFDYFRAWLISNGKDFYNTVLEDPDSIAELDFKIDPEEGVEFEIFAYAVNYVYEEKYSEKIPLEIDHNYPRHPKGKDWENEDLRDRFPKTWMKYKGRIFE